MITLNDYLYSGNTVLKILQIYPGSEKRSKNYSQWDWSDACEFSDSDHRAFRTQWFPYGSVSEDSGIL